MEGRSLGTYRIESELGSGGMGKVWLGRDERDVPYAVKVVHPHLLESPGFFKRFLREAEVGRAVRHPNVVRTFDCDQLVLDGVPHSFLVMEYVEGQTLRDLLDELSKVPEELCRHIGREVAKGLCAIHEAGVVHRDLKPENVLITPDHVVKIMDLGVARLADEAIRLSQTGAFVGSPHYAAPEQFKGGGDDLDGRADLHALGLILYELSSGEHPFIADDMPKVLRKVLEEEPRRLANLNPQLSPFFEEVVHTLLAKNREKRFAAAADLLQVLEDGERSTWWQGRARAIRAETKRPLRRIRIPRETAVYGREAELGKLRALYEQAKDGDGQAVLVEGEAGIGKTRLVDELVGRLEQDGEDLNFLFGSYPPGGAATAAGAWSTAYREHFGGEGLTETLTEYLTVTPVLIPAFAALLRGEPPPEGKEPLTKDSVQTVFVHATRALARERTTVVLIEDLHFAPEEGRAMLASLALAVPEHRILLVGTARPGLPEEWTANLERLEQASQLELPRLGPKDLTKLLIDAFQSERLAEELAFRIAQKSDGNPFFVFEIIRGLREGQFITRRPDGTWVSTQVIEQIEIPSSVQDLIQARIADLDEEEQEILDVAACCGFEFDPDLVAEALDRRQIPVLRSLGHLERSHRLVRSAGEDFVFDHHQVQESLYEGLSPKLRRAYHAAIGEAIETRHPEPDGATAVDLCEHFLKGAQGEKALPRLDAALDHLEEGYLNDQAIALAERALEVPGLLVGKQRVEILSRQVSSLAVLGRRASHESALREAVALADASPDKALQAKTRLALGSYFGVLSRREEARSEILAARKLAREIGDKKTEGNAATASGIELSFLGRHQEAQEEYEAAHAIARETGDRRETARITMLLGVLSFELARYDEAQERCEAALAFASETGDIGGEAAATINLGNVMGCLGLHDRARERYTQGIALARKCGNRLWEANALANLGLVCWNLGRWEEARGHYERHLAVAREIEDRYGEGLVLLNMGNLLACLGDIVAARDLLEGSCRLLHEIGARVPEGAARVGLASVEAVEGRSEQAERLFDRALEIWEGASHPKGVAESLATLGGLHADSGRPEVAKSTLEEALALGREIELPTAIVLATCRLACLADADVGGALAAFEELGSRLDHRMRMEARFLLWKATNDPTHLEEAHRLLCYLRDHAPEEYRETMIENVPLHRDIMAAWEEQGVAD